VRQWLSTRQQQPAGKPSSILLLTGPSGCGKTACLRLVAKDLNIAVNEWTNVDAATNTEFGDFHSGDLNESQLYKFSAFLFRASRYPSLVLGNASVHNIVLVEDFPNAFLQRPAQLHDVLRHYQRHGLCPVVFIVSTCACENLDHLLFPKVVQDELSIENISFNPVAATALLKVLTRISETEVSQNKSKLQVPSRDTLHSLVVSSSGDIRTAVNTLQFFCCGTNKANEQRASCKLKNSTRKKPGNHRTGNKVQKKSTAAVETSDSSFASGKDPVLSLFHAIGKILHCKRQLDEPIQSDLPPHLHQFCRCLLLVDPEDAVEKAHV
jgi:cell cycle checkpoint protein